MIILGGNLQKQLNEVLNEEVQVPEDRLLGPFFLSPTELDADDLTEAVAGKVLPIYGRMS